MSNFQASCSKTLVRNTKQRVPKTNVTTEPDIKSRKEEKNKLPNKHEAIKKKVDLGLPTINGSNTVIQRIKQVEKLKQNRAKSLSEVDDKSKSTIQEKITKQMNFPYDQHVFKDLIPLCVRPTVQQIPVSRYPLSLKDKEPDLKDFVKHKTFLEHSFEVPAYSKSQKVLREHDGFKMYKLIQRW